jgi:hypothetical protein
MTVFELVSYSIVHYETIRLLSDQFGVLLLLPEVRRHPYAVKY